MTTPLRVGIDVAQLSDRALTGIPLYIESLLREYLNDPQADERFLLFGSQKGTDLGAFLRERVLGGNRNTALPEIVPAVDWRIAEAAPALGRAPLLGSLVRKIDGRILLPLSASATSRKVDPPVDVFHHTSTLRLAPGRAKRHIVTIYDLTMRFYPQTHNRVNIHEWERVFTFARERADMVIADSESARQDIIEHLGIPADRVRSIPLGVRPLPRNLPEDVKQAAREKFGLAGGPFVLAAGSLEPRKNLPRLIEAFSLLSREPGMGDVRLAITGARLHGASAVEEAIQKHGMKERVVLTGYASDEDLAALMQGCDCFIYPSVYEGFGLPVVEAMALGAPVVTSNVSSLPEVAGDAALLIDPHSTEAIADGMRRVLSDPFLAADLRRRGPERAALFSWKRCADAHRALYREIAP